MKMFKAIISSAMLAVTLTLIGCMHPQIVEPFSTGFADDEYLVIRITDNDQLGQLYYALPEVDEKGKALPLRWQGTTKLLFPTSQDINKVKTTTQEQVRYAFEKVGGSGKFTVAAIAELSVTADAAYKYESKSQGAARIDMTTMRYATPAAEFIRKKLSENPKYKFAYMSALYQGTAFVEVLSNVKSAGSGSYAAFQVGGDYYTSKNKNIATSGPIIFQLTRIDPCELDVACHDMTAEKWIQPSTTMMAVGKGVEHAPQPKQKLKPLTAAQLQNIKENLPPKTRAMLE